MGQYDNYSNSKNIAKLQKKLDALTRKRNPDLYEIECVRKQLDIAKMFDHCQIFGSVGFFQKCFDPNEDIMFSDDHEAMMFGDQLIWYKDIKSYAIIENVVHQSRTSSKTTGVVTRALAGGVIAGSVGALIGASTANTKSVTTHYDSKEGFWLQIFLKNGKGYQCPVPSSGAISNKIPQKWMQLATKLQTIIDEHNI